MNKNLKTGTLKGSSTATYYDMSNLMLSNPHNSTLTFTFETTIHNKIICFPHVQSTCEVGKPRFLKGWMCTSTCFTWQ
jgi:hypothetical protein